MINLFNKRENNKINIEPLYAFGRNEPSFSTNNTIFVRKKIKIKTEN